MRRPQRHHIEFALILLVVILGYAVAVKSALNGGGRSVSSDRNQAATAR